MRIVNDKIHGVIDYVAAITLVAVPIFGNFEAIDPVAYWLSIIAGTALFIYSLVTCYTYSVLGLFSFGFHLALDFAVGLVFLAAPFFFGFDGTPRVFFLASGTAVIVLVFITKPRVKIVPTDSSETEFDV